MSGPLLFVALALGIAFIVVATTRYKMHPFLALLVTAYGMGLCGGLSPSQTITAITGGFGRTVGFIGIVIACGLYLLYRERVRGVDLSDPNARETNL